MAKEVCATFSVKDHCEENAFVAEVMLYDRLAIPVPTPGSEKYWKPEWKLDRLYPLLEILKDRVIRVPWDAEKHTEWKTQYENGLQFAQDTGDLAFEATRAVLVSSLPPNVTGIQAVTSYNTMDEMRKDLNLQESARPPHQFDHGRLVAIVGHEFLIPTGERRSHEDLLRDAVELSAAKDASLKRKAFWRWQRELFADRCITDQSALVDATEELNVLLEEYKAAILRSHIKTALQYGFLAGAIGVGLLSGPLSPLTIGTGFISLGQFAADKLTTTPEKASPIAVIHDARKHFGWR